MKIKLLFIALFTAFYAKAQNTKPVAVAPAQLCKDWKIVAYEMFGKVMPPEDNEKNDHILLNADFTCTAVEHGNTTTASWSAHNSLKHFVIIPTSKHRRVYQIQSIQGNEMKVMYQDSTLVKRIYHLRAN